MINYETAGDPAAPALMLLHGFMSSTLQWSPNVERLSESFHVVSIDLWGHGESPAPRDEAAYSVDGYAEAFDTVREALGIRQWGVCGQSFGAGIAMKYAHARRSDVSAIITTNSRSVFAADFSSRAPRHTQDEWLEADLRRLPYHPRHARRFPPELRERMAAVADRLDRYGLWAAMTITGPQLSCRTILPEIEQPFLLINGLWERSFQPERHYVETVMPEAQFVDLEGGHSVNIEEPVGFNKAVARFLTSLG